MRSKGNAKTFVSGMMAGSGLMYLLDTDKAGSRRRALVRDKVVRAEHVAGRFADKTVRDMQNRAKGLVVETWARLRERDVPDAVLVQRVRARLGRAVSHPHAIAVEAHDGVVTLSGPVLAHEVERLLRTVRSVRGVRAIENQLEPHPTAAGVPDLQGCSRRPGAELDILQENWSPATRTLVGLGGVGLVSAGRRAGPLRLPLEICGGVLLLRSLLNMPLAKAFGLSRTPRLIMLQKTVNLNVAVEEVYTLFSNPENFPRIFEHVKDVRHSRENLYHWTVAGPAGISVSWEAMMTDNVPNQLVGWRSLPTEAVSTAGHVRFQQNPDGSTAVHIQLTYNPPAGIIGHAIASLFGADPKHELDDDMARLKSLFENGKTTVHHHRVTRDEVEREIVNVSQATRV